MLQSGKNRAIVTAAAGAVAAASLALAAGGGSGSSSTAAAQGAPAFSNPRVIDNRYLPLSTKRRCMFRGRTKDGSTERSVLTRLDRTRRFTVGGRRVDAAVFEDRAYEDGKHVE